MGRGKDAICGLRRGPKRVVRLTAKRVIIALKQVKSAEEPITVAVEPDCVVVVDKLLHALAG